MVFILKPLKFANKLAKTKPQKLAIFQPYVLLGEPLLANRTQNEVHGAKQPKSMGILPSSIYTFDAVTDLVTEIVTTRKPKTRTTERNST